MIICPYKEMRRYAAVIPGLEEAMALIDSMTDPQKGTYPLSCGKIMVQEGVTHPLEGAKLEAHREFLDIQYVLEGSEVCGWAPTDAVELLGEFDTDRDVGFYTGPSTPITMTPGMCYILYPEDAHAPCAHLEAPTEYKKMVVKLAL